MRYPFLSRLNRTSPPNPDNAQSAVANPWILDRVLISLGCGRSASPVALLVPDDPRTYFNLEILTSTSDQDTPDACPWPVQIRSLAVIPVSASPAASTALLASASISRAPATAGSAGAA